MESGYEFVDEGSESNYFWVCICGYTLHISTAITSDTKIGTIPSGHRPKKDVSLTVPVALNNVTSGYANIRIKSNGEIHVEYMSSSGHIILRLPMLVKE